MGDLAEITTPSGSLRARVMVHAGITPGVAAFEHGFGHRELGARAHRIGNARQPEDRRLAAGVNLNDIGLNRPNPAGQSAVGRLGLRCRRAQRPAGEDQPAEGTQNEA